MNLKNLWSCIVGKFKTTRKGNLDHATIYLSGPMEFVADAGVEWRKNFRRLIEEKGLKIKVIDPTQKPGESATAIAENKSYQERLQQEGRFEELRCYVHNYRRKDLRFVDISDAIVAVIDRNIYQCGTLNEVFVAEAQHKPILAIVEGGLYKLPRWLFDVLDFNLIFESVEEVIEYLELINQQENILDDRWVLVRKYL
jgi:nucleoside 2-deoxyribosyltransferase